MTSQSTALSSVGSASMVFLVPDGQCATIRMQAVRVSPSLVIKEQVFHIDNL